MQEELEEEFPEGPSKTQRKREMEALQDIGLELVKRSKETLVTFDLPEALFDAVIEAKRLTKNEAKRRQMQFIGRLMRDIDPAPIRKKLEELRGESAEHNALLHETERWRERLLADERSFEEFARNFPRADLSHLRSLVRSVQKDRANEKPPKLYRTLYRELRDILFGTESHED